MSTLDRPDHEPPEVPAGRVPRVDVPYRSYAEHHHHVPEWRLLLLGAGPLGKGAGLGRTAQMNQSFALGFEFGPEPAALVGDLRLVEHPDRHGA